MSLDRLLQHQGGVITLRQAVELGIAKQTVHRWSREGSWTRLRPSVYLVGGHRLTDEVRVRAAWLWAGGAAAVSGPAAAYWHGLLERAPVDIELTVPHCRKPRANPGLTARRRNLHHVDLVDTRGVRVTAVPLTGLETAVALPRGSAFLDRTAAARPLPHRVPGLLLQHGQDGLVRCRPPAHRSPSLRSVDASRGRCDIDSLASSLTAAADRADSAAERLLVRIMREAGVTGWVLGHPFGPWRIDIAFPRERMAVEVDGWAWHVDADRFRNDRRKQNALVRAGEIRCVSPGTTSTAGRARWSVRSRRPAAAA